MFVRAGAVIPLQAVKQHVNEMNDVPGMNSSEMEALKQKMKEMKAMISLGITG